MALNYWIGYSPLFFYFFTFKLQKFTKLRSNWLSPPGPLSGKTENSRGSDFGDFDLDRVCLVSGDFFPEKAFFFLGDLDLLQSLSDRFVRRPLPVGEGLTRCVDCKLMGMGGSLRFIESCRVTASF